MTAPAPAHARTRDELTIVDQSPAPPVPARPAVRRLWLWSALLVLPYLLLGLAWVFSNPPNAAPDEVAHLVKSLGVGRLDIGTQYTGPPVNQSTGQIRNASIARVVTIPKALNPIGYDCFAFRPNQSAACLPHEVPGVPGTVAQVTPMGAYPPYIYLPIGVAALTADTPPHAFYMGRLAVLAMSAILLLLGFSYLLRWVGPGALVGMIVGIVPMAMFTFSILSTSGVEIAGALTVATVTGVTLVKPESILTRSSHLTLAAAGSMLVLSRQLGVISAGVLILLTLLAAGPALVWRMIKEHRPSFVVSVVALLSSVAAITWWERTFDHPNQLGAPFSFDAWQGFLGTIPLTLESGLGRFGWLDTPLPAWCIIVWTVLMATLVGAALILARWRARVVMLTLMVVTVVVSYVMFAIVFAPITSFLQGRDVVSLFIGVPVIAGVVLSARLASLGLWRELRQFVLTASILAAAVQFTAIYANGHRYASGIKAPWWYLTSASWSPPRGWWLWLVIAALGAAALAVLPWLAARGRRPALDGGDADVAL